MLNLIAWAVLGIIAGAIGKAIYPGTQGGGILATMILGIVGSLLGGIVYGFVSGQGLGLITSAGATTGGVLSLPSIAVAVVGSIIAIFLWGLIARRSSI
jgi:uncharacterized membrane protein YeaQ/YmgE (transglycosylase-associated protein family)